MGQRSTNVDTVTASGEKTHREEVMGFQEVNGIYNRLYLYNADLGFITPPYADAFAPKRYLLTSDVTPHYYVVASSRYRGSLVFTPRTKVRILDEPSQPIRTPSFMPALTYYLRMADNTVRYRYLTFNATHHSNGQAGPSLLPNGFYNTFDGTFSTNFVELGYHWGTASPVAFESADTSPTIQPKNLNAARPMGISYGKLAFIRHIGNDAALAGRYGFTRLTGKYNRIRLGQYARKQFGEHRQVSRIDKAYIAEKHRITVDAQWIFGALYTFRSTDVGRRLNAEVSYYYRLPFQYANSYLYAAAGYYGQDPYNVYFNDQYLFARIGAAFGISVYRGRAGN